MIEYSKQESNIFNVPFGRLNLDENFNDWEELKQEINTSPCKFIRVKIKNPNGIQLDKLISLTTNAHLLEILRVYSSEHLSSSSKTQEDLIIEIADNKNNSNLGQFVLDTYEDIPFGNYTSSTILNIIPKEKQLKALAAYFNDFYTGQSDDKCAIYFYNTNKKLIGCSILDLKHEGEKSTAAYIYYIGVSKDERNKGNQFKIVQSLKSFIQNKGIERLYCSTRLLNLFSARAFEKNQYKCIRHDWVYLLEK